MMESIEVGEHVKVEGLMRERERERERESTGLSVCIRVCNVT
jgi:hypothetical protein